MTGPPPDELLDATTPAQLKALGHPLRQRLLFAIGRTPATISQLAVLLDVRKGTVAHHLAVLRDAGLVRVGRTRAVRGGTEQYYERTSRRIRVEGSPPGSAAAMLGAVAAEVAAADGDPLLHLRHLHLTTAQADRLRATLLDLVENAEEAGDDQPRHGVLIGLYRQATPDTPD